MSAVTVESRKSLTTRLEFQSPLLPAYLTAFRTLGSQSAVMLILCLLSLAGTVSAFFNPYRGGMQATNNGDVGKVLILTPYIESGKIAEARKLAAVPPFFSNVTSYSGFLTVNKTCESNLFFWFFPAESNDPNAPLAVWLQGGPGASSMYGLLVENGPYELTPDNRLALRKYSWTRVASYIFIDNPVGTGFSFTKKDECFARNQIDVGRDLLNAVKQFLSLFPEYKKSPFFITGESYGGKYVPALAYAIHKEKDPKMKINLHGLALGNGFSDPVNQMDYSDYLYQLSLIDTKQKEHMRKIEEQCKALIWAEKWVEATLCFDELLDGDISESTYFQNATGFSYYFNFLYSKGQPEGNITAFLNKSQVRKSIHVGNTTFSEPADKVYKFLEADIAKSVRPWIEELLEHYRVLIYNGQLDIIVAYPLTEGYLQKLNWSAAFEYKAAKRHIWYVDNEVAGYAKTGGKLTEVLVRNAGHMAPMDQPKWSFDLISRFFNNKPFF